MWLFQKGFWANVREFLCSRLTFVQLMLNSRNSWMARNQTQEAGGWCLTLLLHCTGLNSSRGYGYSDVSQHEKQETCAGSVPGHGRAGKTSGLLAPLINFEVTPKPCGSIFEWSYLLCQAGGSSACPQPGLGAAEV